MTLVLSRRGRVLLACAKLVEAKPARARVLLGNSLALCSSIGSVRTLSASCNSRLFRHPLPILLKKTYATATGTAKADTAASKAGSKPVKKKAATAKNPSRKTVKKSTKAKPKTKSKVKRSRKPNKQLTEKQMETLRKRKAREMIKNLKAVALVPPKGLPETPIMLLQKQMKQFGGATEAYKNLSPAERESLNQTAQLNRASNKTMFQDWVKSHTPLQIKQANMARQRLRKLFKKPRRFMKIRDDRQIKRPVNAYLFFLKEAFASGGIFDKESMSKTAAAWRGMTAGEKEELQQKYQQMALENKNKYLQQHKSIYGMEAPSQSKSPSPA
ncbi:hypothetical protein ACO22_00824 [Paracoccidioides brasiliensis]|uniref:Uncharacterized protein n=1 Tax=Paracoccidioides brasiliensis TaxID=121759 RepID=A0A1D2JN73_PARBR|nr:hypothetical protein ACO22_00824 [Paracoccidioides brasiliensis]ODH50869.1 hypothetical protein GX48_03011 [Paracoccidioides brasiliensis]